jgi:NAD(P)-dependent dehydrogenase (short-subunit alcohol dehydrogenase family)
VVADLFDLTGTTAIVTGSSRGIGLGIGRALLQKGAAVLINGYDPTETAEAADVLRSECPPGVDNDARVAALAGDVSDTAVASRLVEHAVDEFGRLDHLVCNAGIDIIKPAVDYQIEEWERVLSVNLRGSFLPAQAAARYWIGLGHHGSVTMTSSIAGQVGIPSLAPYAASKGGVNQLVRTLAAEWAGHGIRVNAIAPGYVANIMNNVTVHDDPASDRRINTFTPAARRANIEEIAAPYAFLASPAAAYITGAILNVDGGYTAT